MVGSSDSSLTPTQGTSNWMFTDRMGQLVSSEITVPTENLMALVTLIWLVIRMGKEVGLEVAPLVETPLAYWAFMWRFFHVKNSVDSKCS